MQPILVVMALVSVDVAAKAVFFSSRIFAPIRGSKGELHPDLSTIAFADGVN